MRPSSFLLSVPLTTLLSVQVAHADNPIIQTKYTADPAPLVYNDTVYLYTSHDEDNATGFTMYNYMLYTSTDMVNWTDHGILAGVRDPYKTWKWADGSNAWAPQVIFRNNKFYMYAPFPKGGRMMIGVAVSDQPTGPFVDPLGGPLVDNPNSTGHDIDPTVLIDDDGQAYMYWGHQPPLYYVKLNQDMTSYSGSIVQLTRPQTFEEGPWMFKRDKLYYLSWASTCCPEGIGYAMSDKPTGPWTFKGSIMDGDSRSSGNHPGIIQFKGTWYVFGFNYAISYPQTTTQPLPGGHTERRSVCVEEFTYAADGTIPKLPWWTTTGAAQIGTLNPYVQTEAETIAFSKGLKTETCGEGGMDVTDINNGDYIKVNGVDFGSGATSFEARVASATSGGSIEIRLDSLTGNLVGTCAVQGTGGAQTWATKSCTIQNATGVHDLYFKFIGSGTGTLFNFNWWKFSGPGADDNRPDGAVPDAGSDGPGDGGAGGTIGDRDAGTGGARGSGGAGGAAGTSSNAGGSSSGGAFATGGTTGRGGRSGTSLAAGGSGSAGTTSAAGGSGGVGTTSAAGGSGRGGAISSAGGSGGNSRSDASGGAIGSSGSTGTSVDRGADSGCACRLGSRRAGGLSGFVGVSLVVLLAISRRRTQGRTGRATAGSRHDRYHPASGSRRTDHSAHIAIITAALEYPWSTNFHNSPPGSGSSLHSRERKEVDPEVSCERNSSDS